MYRVVRATECLSVVRETKFSGDYEACVQWMRNNCHRAPKGWCFELLNPLGRWSSYIL
jgi:hypothetical protein